MGIDASKSVSRFRTLLKAKREQFRRLVCEGLERRELMAVFAPGTTEEYRDAWYAAHPLLERGIESTPSGPHSFNLLGSRWTNPTGGPSPNMGDPARVTWSIVPDGTRVGSGPSDLQASNLIAFMDGKGIVVDGEGLAIDVDGVGFVVGFKAIGFDGFGGV